MDKQRFFSLNAALAAIALGLLFAAWPSAPAAADGIIVPNPPICEFGGCPEPSPIRQLAIEYHHVSVEIDHQLAVTHVDQVFRNDNDWPVEGIYLFPLPPEAAVSEFTLWIDGEPVEGEILDRDQARATYEEIVRSMRDPALLEYVDRGAVQASIFPIPPGGERRIELEYTQVLQADNGLIRYRYPLNTEKFSTLPLEEVSISVRVRSDGRVKAIYSPSHEIDIDRESDTSFTVGYEAYDVTPDRDFELLYSIAQDEIGLSLVTFRDPQRDDPDGFFLLLASPGLKESDRQAVAKDVVLVLDRSGSMDGEKFRQAQRALKYILGHLEPRDRFNIIAFSTGTRAYASSLRPAEEAAEAIRWVDSLSAAGSTDIQRALLEAMDQADDERPTILIFLTDGLPTEGVTDSSLILEDVKRAAPENIRLFAFGVGYDVDTFLLDSLAQENHGASSYVTPGEAIDERVSGFYEKVSLPVLTNLRIDFGEISAFDSYPEPLPDLFAGGQLVLVGRYRGSGTETLRLSGEVNGETRTFTYPGQQFRSSGGSSFLPRLWATRKIGALLRDVRLHGPQEELVDQIVRLSIRYGIVTPYTSYLVTEPMTLGAAAQESIAADAFEEMLAAPAAASGEKAVGRAEAESAFREADVALPLNETAADIVRVAGARTFRQVDGVWVDTAFDPQTMSTIKVPFLSQEYFDLAAAQPDIAAALALGPRAILVEGNQAFEIVDEGQPGDTFTLPETESEPPASQPADASSSLPEPSPAKGSLNFPCAGPAFTLAMILAAAVGVGDKRFGRSD